MSDTTLIEDTPPDIEHSRTRKAVYWTITLGLMLLLIEVLASAALLYRYRSQTGPTVIQDEISSFSSINLIYKVGRRVGLFDFTKYQKETQPDPFFRPDSKLGYSVSPGVYIHTYFHRWSSQSDWRSLKVKVTIDEDGTRWTGGTEQTAKPSVFVFGGSIVFGSGVNDEHTFAYLLQQARPDLNVRLFALGGYSLTQAYLRFEDLKDSMKSDDIIVLGYADFYDSRHVMAPSWVRSFSEWNAERTSRELGFYLPKTSLVDGSKIKISYVYEDCLNNDSYCEDSDPSNLEMTRVTAALINHIADNTLARVYLLHFFGNKNNPIFELTRNVSLISALPSDFDYFIRDDIEGFDPHPGPYWHYAISRKLLQVLSDN